MWNKIYTCDDWFQNKGKSSKWYRRRRHDVYETKNFSHLSDNESSINLKNDKVMKNPQDVMVELRNKQHIKICPVNFLSSIFPSTTNSKCVVGFEDMDPNKRYVSVRSD